ncbi:MAG: hypothetical protein ACLPKI_11925 [Streptosporangiaceae bacterium]
MWTADRLPALAPVRAWRPAPAAVPALASPALASPALPSPATGSQGSAGQCRPGAGPAGPQPARRPPLTLRLASCCNIVMGLVIAYMLIVSL